VGNIKGNITQIRIRATTVVDWDHFEHIIPNKEMITKPVENWTLSDLKRRLVIHVGVPYGCDYDQAREILLKVARQNTYVMKDPGPAAGIERLGDSSVVFVVFAHLPNSDSYLDARHTLIAEFERQLSAVGITIPFPQLDVHMDPPQGPVKS
jgi:potassium efflux system protein